MSLAPHFLRNHAPTPNPMPYFPCPTYQKQKITTILVINVRIALSTYAILAVRKS